MSDADDIHGRQAKYRKTAFIRITYTSCYKRNKQDKHDLKTILLSLLEKEASTVLTDFALDNVRVELLVMGAEFESKAFRTILSKS